jgi:hypothetical protein
MGANWRSARPTPGPARSTLFSPRARIPDPTSWYVSGYSEDVIVRYGVAGPDVALVRKPYSPDLLAAKVREVLGLE